MQRRAGWAKDDPTSDYKPVMDLAQFDALRQRVENGVIDFKGNPSPYTGAPAAKISKSELNAIKRCIDSTKAKP